MMGLTPVSMLTQSLRSGPRKKSLALSLSSSSGTFRSFSSEQGSTATAASATAFAKDRWIDDNGIYKHFVKGKFEKSPSTAGGGLHSVINPATNEVVGKVPDTLKEEFESIVATAQSAFLDWKPFQSNSDNVLC
jgi:hypothetical protein